MSSFAASSPTRTRAVAVLLLGLCMALGARAIDTAFTYQGVLKQNGTLAQGPYDFQFQLYDAASGGSALAPGSTIYQDVLVSNGVFTLVADQGQGQQTYANRWLEIRVRDGASSGVFTTLLPRQRLTATPFAYRAEQSAAALSADSVPWSGVANKPAGFADNSDDGITSIGAGPGLSGGPITSSGTLRIADGGVVTAMLGADAVTQDKLADHAVGSLQVLDGSVGTADINENEVQRRVTGSCPAGSAMRVIAVNGQVLCTTVGDHAIDSFLSGGGQSDLAGAATTAPDNGLVVFVWTRQSSGDLMLARCEDGDCQQPLVPFTVEATGNVGYFPDIVADAAGNLWISHVDVGIHGVRLVRCLDFHCSSSTGIVLADLVQVQTGTSIVIPPDGLPVVAAIDTSANDLYVIKCLVASCASFSVSIADTNANSHPSMIVGSDGLPMIGFQRSAGAYILKCGNAACNAGNSVTTVNSGGNSPMLAQAPDGRPVLALNAAGLSIYKCLNASCGSVSAVANIDSDTVSGPSSLVVGKDNIPMIAYRADTDDVRLARCSSRDCSGAPALINTVVWQTSSIGPVVVGLSQFARPVLLYGNGTLSARACGNRLCL